MDSVFLNQYYSLAQCRVNGITDLFFGYFKTIEINHNQILFLCMIFHEFPHDFEHACISIFKLYLDMFCL